MTLSPLISAHLHIATWGFSSQFKMRKQTLHAQRAVFVARQDRIGYNDDRCPVLSRYQCEAIRFTFGRVKSEINRVILLQRIAALLWRSGSAHHDAIFSDTDAFHDWLRFLLSNWPTHHCVQFIGRQP